MHALSVSGGRVSGVETSAGPIPADAVVLAGRAGPDRVAGARRLRLAAGFPAWLHLDAASDPDRPTRLLVSRGVALVPRRDGTLLALGRERAESASAGPGAGNVARLLAELQRLVPASSGWRLLETGARREHAAPDRLPVLGEAAAGLWVATGWGPDELLLTPAAAAVVADLVTGRVPPLAATAFAPGRIGA